MFFKKKLKDFDPEKEQKLRSEIEAGGGTEKGDLPAMILSALLVFMPVAIAVMAVFAFLAWLFVK